MLSAGPYLRGDAGECEYEMLGAVGAIAGRSPAVTVTVLAAAETLRH